MRISDEIREWCKWCDEHSAARDELCKLADRIDREMVELPKDADGVPIHVGDTVYTATGCETNVAKIYIMPDTVNVELRFTSGGLSDFIPSYLTHERHDSFERIADDIEDFCVDYDIKGDHEAFDRAMDFAYRIRKLGYEIEEER